jgi:hypothetical protein
MACPSWIGRSTPLQMIPFGLDWIGLLILILILLLLLFFIIGEFSFCRQYSPSFLLSRLRVGQVWTADQCDVLPIQFNYGFLNYQLIFKK